MILIIKYEKLFGSNDLFIWIKIFPKKKKKIKQTEKLMPIETVKT